MRFLLPALIVIGVALAALWVATRPTVAEQGVATAAAPESAAAGEPFVCPVTTAPETAFVPPEPWPADPPLESEFWYGTPDLWVALDRDGHWDAASKGIKFWWWSEHFDVTVEERPALTMNARRLDGDAPPFVPHEATNGYHESIHWAMLAGVDLPTSGCWEITGEYKGHTLTYVVEIE